MRGGLKHDVYAAAVLIAILFAAFKGHFRLTELLAKEVRSGGQFCGWERGPLSAVVGDERSRSIRRHNVKLKLPNRHESTVLANA